MIKKKTLKRPAIQMIEAEAEALTNLAMQVSERLPDVSDLLLGEIERASVHSASRIPGDVVTMMSTVEFVDETHGATRTVQLVYPKDADIAADRISILTPVGAGLIGMREGQSILWPDREGQKRTLTIIKVTHPATPG